MKYQNDITVLQETVMNLKSSKKLLQKELGKAKLMLRTQQVCNQIMNMNVSFILFSIYFLFADPVG